MEFKPSVNLKKFDIDPRQLEGLISKEAEAGVLQQGCQYCHGSNLTVYVNEVERTEIHGLYYCHDCNQEGTYTVQHDVIEQYEAIVIGFQNDLRKMFSGR